MGLFAVRRGIVPQQHPSSELATTARLLAPGEPPAYEQLPGDSKSAFLIACDHASNRIPERLGTLGLSQADLVSHIAWDIGIRPVAHQLGVMLGAHVVLSSYSRLVIDCNRPLNAQDSIAKQSGGVTIPSNLELSEQEVASRIDEVFRPYHARIEAELEQRRRFSKPTIFVALHSFTPILYGKARPWQVGVLYQRDARMARLMLEGLRSEPGLQVGDNEPYRVTDMSDYSIINYGEKTGLPHVEIEVRQDLISDGEGQLEWAERLAKLLAQAQRELGI